MKFPDCLRNIFLLVLIGLNGSVIFGQKKELPIQFSILNESTSLPYTRIFTTPIHPGFQIGFERNIKSGKNIRRFQTLNLSYFYHSNLVHGLSIFPEFCGEYKFKSGLAFSGLFGLGYLHTFSVAKEYQFQNGQYVEKTDWGNPRLLVSLSSEVGYYYKPQLPASPKVFLKYQIWAEYPYSPGFIPVMTHVNFHLGLRFVLNSKIHENK